MNKNICFFGAASDKVEEKYKKEIKEIGCFLAKRGYNLVFGGGEEGLMGAMAKGFTEGHGFITGIYPVFIEEFEGVYKLCDEHIKTNTMQERKQLMEQKADLFLVGPGGIGTMDELFEVLTDKSLNLYKKAVILLNFDDFYKEIITFINNKLNNGVIPKERFHDFYICNNKEELENLLYFIS